MSNEFLCWVDDPADVEKAVSVFQTGNADGEVYDGIYLYAARKGCSESKTDALVWGWGHPQRSSAHTASECRFSWRVPRFTHAEARDACLSESKTDALVWGWGHPPRSSAHTAGE